VDLADGKQAAMLAHRVAIGHPGDVVGDGPRLVERAICWYWGGSRRGSFMKAPKRSWMMRRALSVMRSTW
jgi:hypothetical protein